MSRAVLREFLNGVPPPSSRHHVPDRPHHHARAAKRMEQIDSLPAEMRGAVHRHGFALVKAFMDCGVRKANQIDHLVALVRHETTDGRPADYGNYAPKKLKAGVV